MTGRERILAALELRKADRVPTYVHAMNEASIINIGKHFTDGLPQIKQVNLMTPEEQFKLAETLVLIHEELEVDGITAVPLDVEEPIDDVRFRNSWGVVMQRNPHGLPVPVGHPIRTPADLEGFRLPEPNPGYALMVIGMLKPMLKTEMALWHFIEGPFTRAWYLRGMQTMLMDFIRNPDVVRRLTRLTTDHALTMIDLVADAGADVCIVEDDVADKHNPFVSPAHYGEFIRPCHEEIVQRAHERGMKIAFHSDGNLWPILDHIVGAGYDGLNPLEPEAGMDLERVKAAYGDRICLVGNIECGELLSHGTTAEVEAAVKHAIEVGGPGGGYILSESNSIHPGVKPANFIAMMRAAKRYGAYATGATV